MGLILDCIAFVEADSANRKALFAQYWKDRFPIVKWFPKYTRKKLVSDIIAGLTVGLMVVPQSLAYARIAGFNDLTVNNSTHHPPSLHQHHFLSSLSTASMRLT
eukprot:m.39393 g.39393  ORF g.39393 m.39393 type:complete len:104 (+) comp32725_c0_seq8:34-345(+)